MEHKKALCMKDLNKGYLWGIEGNNSISFIDERPGYQFPGTFYGKSGRFRSYFVLYSDGKKLFPGKTE